MSASTRRRLVLLVEDDDSFRQMIVKLLTRAGLAVKQARNGLDGLRLFRDTRPDLVITDIVMPDGEGIGLIRAIRAENTDCPILAMCGAAHHQLYLRGARALGADKTITKPFRIAETLDMVNSLLGVTGQAGGVPQS